MDVRYENKYLLNKKQFNLIKQFLDENVEKDIHVNEDGLYNVRTLYLKNLNKKYNDKLRIRIYNNDLRYINLEFKTKKEKSSVKLKIPISINIVNKILNGQFLNPNIIDDIEDAQILKSSIDEYNSKKIIPKVILDYNRFAYENKKEKIRITLDENICATYNVKEFLSKNYNTVNILKKYYGILEIKFENENDLVTKLIQDFNLKKVSFSKYHMSINLLDDYYLDNSNKKLGINIILKSKDDEFEIN